MHLGFAHRLSIDYPYTNHILLIFPEGLPLDDPCDRHGGMRRVTGRAQEPSLCWQFALATGHHLLAVGVP